MARTILRDSEYSGIGCLPDVRSGPYIAEHNDVLESIVLVCLPPEDIFVGALCIWGPKRQAASVRQAEGGMDANPNMWWPTHEQARLGGRAHE